eukprot:scaffold13706_cov121-Isochrysis_galbana.AAC.3
MQPPLKRSIPRAARPARRTRRRAPPIQVCGKGPANLALASARCQSTLPDSALHRAAEPARALNRERAAAQLAPAATCSREKAWSPVAVGVLLARRPVASLP